MRTIYAVHFLTNVSDTDLVGRMFTKLAMTGYECEEIHFNAAGQQCDQDETALDEPVYELSLDGKSIRVLGTLEPDWHEIDLFAQWSSTQASSAHSFYTYSKLCKNAVVRAFTMGLRHEETLRIR